MTKKRELDAQGSKGSECYFFFVFPGVECGSPPQPPNTVPIPPTEAEKQFTFNSKVAFQCSEGHLPRGDLSVRCSENGTWSGFRGQCSSKTGLHYFGNIKLHIYLHM